LRKHHITLKLTDKIPFHDVEAALLGGRNVEYPVAVFGTGKAPGGLWE
jgi:hypothetical protein